MPPKNVIDLNKYLGFAEPKAPKPITRLKLHDRQIILLSLEGWTTQEIVEQLRVSPARVRRVLASEQCQRVFEDFLSFKDREFQNLYQLSINAVRDALRSDDIELRLKAADKFFRVHGKYDKSLGSASTTAEDVIRRIMEIKITEERPASTEYPQLTAQNLDSKGEENEEIN